MSDNGKSPSSGDLLPGWEVKGIGYLAFDARRLYTSSGKTYVYIRVGAGGSKKKNRKSVFKDVIAYDGHSEVEGNLVKGAKVQLEGYLADFNGRERLVARLIKVVPRADAVAVATAASGDAGRKPRK